MISKKNIILTSFVALGTALLVLTQTAGSNRQYQLGGAWIGSDAQGDIWSAMQTPIDPDGRTAAGRVQFAAYNAGVAAMLSSLGADGLSDFTGPAAMISRDTAKWRTVGYALKQGNPPVIQGILVSQGTMKHTSPDSAVLNYTYYVYLPTADANGDGLPDVGSNPLMTLPDVVGNVQRVPLQ